VPCRCCQSRPSRGYAAACPAERLGSRWRAAPDGVLVNVIEETDNFPAHKGGFSSRLPTERPRGTDSITDSLHRPRPATSWSPRPPSSSPPAGTSSGTPGPLRSVTSTRTALPMTLTATVIISPGSPDRLCPCLQVSRPAGETCDGVVVADSHPMPGDQPQLVVIRGQHALSFSTAGTGEHLAGGSPSSWLRRAVLII
jgi:hypothetical protein